MDLSDRFLISNTGELYSLKSKKILKTRINKNGYEVVCVSLGSRKDKKIIKIHEAVAYNYVAGYSPDLIVNHKDGNKSNNIYTNLEWVTYSENSQHAVLLGLFEPVNRRPIKQIDIKTGETVGTFKSIQDAQQALGGKRRGRNIGHALYDRNKTAYGYKWEFV